MTTGTNTAAILSASRAMGAFSDCAALTMAMICASTVCSETAVHESVTSPSRQSVPQYMRAPAPFGISSLSPVSMDSSAVHAPLSTAPSTGTRSPLRICTISPGVSVRTSTVCTVPPRSTFAVSGWRRISFRIASEAS